MSDAEEDTEREQRAILPDGVHADDVAAACRRAILAFFRGASPVGLTWSKRDLVAWLVGDYGEAAIESDGLSDNPPPWSVRPSDRPIDASRISQLLGPAHDAALQCLRDFAEANEGEPVDEALSRGSIVPAWAWDGTSVFVPVNVPGLPLAMRIRSLLVADFLVRPEDYEGELLSCADCGAPLLGHFARSRGLCDEHIRSSGVVPSAARVSLPDPEDMGPVYIRFK